MHEVERQCVPKPRLLNVWTHSDEGDFMELEQTKEPLHLAFSITDFYPFGFGHLFKHEWHQEKAVRLSTEAFALPSALRDIADFEDTMGAHWIRGYRYNSGSVYIGDSWSMAHLRLDYLGWTLPAFRLKPPRENGGAFPWMRNIRAPANIRSTAFSKEQFEDSATLRWNIPQRLSEHDDLRLFEYDCCISLVRNHPFFSNPNHCE